MIAVDDNGPLISVTVLGEFTLADYSEFETLLNQKLKGDTQLDLYLDLREMISITVDVVWEEIKFSRAHPKVFRRIAVVTDSQWVTWSAWLNKSFVDADLRVFDDSDADEALSWVKSS
jgi:hypothetical protein